MNEKELKVITHYGVLPQLKYFQSEVFELSEAIINCEMGRNYSLTKYTNNTTTTDVHVVRTLINEMEKNK